VHIKMKSMNGNSRVMMMIAARAKGSNIMIALMDRLPLRDEIR
jgi:hypothetical protein